MQEYVQQLREMEDEARAGLARQTELYERIHAERQKAEANSAAAPQRR